MENQIQFWNHRAHTIWRSFKILYTLPMDKVEAFIDSYKIYDFDWKDEDELIDKMGPDYYEQIQKKLVDWYSVINHLCALGDVEKMYIPPTMNPSASITKNQKLFEKKLSKDLGIKKGDKVLDIGCGRGSIGLHIVSLTGAKLWGINIDGDQLKSAKLYASMKGLSDFCTFQLGDMNELPLPFESNSLNAVYQIQAFSISKDLQKLLSEIYRILKPGGKFGCLDWVALPTFDQNNEYHRYLMSCVKPLVGAIGTPTAKEYIHLLKKAGFKIIIKKNLSVDGLQESLISKADAFYKRFWKLTKILVKCNVFPKHFEMMLERLTQNGEAFVEADRLRLITTSYYIIAEKPYQEEQAN